MTFDEIWNLNPVGDKEDAEGRIGQFMTMNGYSLQDIFSKYRQYLNWWQAKHGEKDPKFVGKKDELLPLMDFLMNGMMRQEFALPKTSRDWYFFGDSSAEYLEQAYEDFKAANNL